MRAHRVFRTLWRINAVGLFLVLLFLAGAAIVGLAAAAWDATRPGRGTPRHDVDPATAAPDERRWLGDVVALEGTASVVLPLHAVREEGGLGSYKSAGEATTRNLLFHGPAAGQARWLRPDHAAAIAVWEPLREGGVQSGPVGWLRYEVARADTDGDGQITDADRRDVALSAPDGTGFTVVIADADQLLGYGPPRAGTMLVFYRRGAEDLVAEVDLGARRLRRTAPLPGPGPAPAGGGS